MSHKDDHIEFKSCIHTDTGDENANFELYNIMLHLKYWQF